MNFTAHQRRARRSTWVLLALFALLLATSCAVMLLASGAVWSLLMPSVPWPRWFLEVNLALLAGTTLFGALIEYQTLTDGGTAIAQRLDARRLQRQSGPGDDAASRPVDDADLDERRIVHMIDELALASGLPRPRAWIIDADLSINAFCCGTRPADYAVFVTAGALRRLTRTELLGVLAHEMAHLGCGDVALHTRLAAMQGGLSMVLETGRSMLPEDLASIGIRPGRLSHPASALLVPLGIALWLYGLAGHAAALVLGAAIGRHREWLADATAVQMLRDSAGLAGALRKIAWMQHHTDSAADRDEVRRAALRNGGMTLAAGIAASPGLQRALLDDGIDDDDADAPGWSERLMATHPSLDERIERLLGFVEAPLPAPLLRGCASARRTRPALPAFEFETGA